MELLKLLKLDKFSKRDIYILSGITSFLVIIFMYWTFSVLLFKPLAQNEKKFKSNLENIKKIQTIKAEYEGLNSKLSAFKARLPRKGFNLSSYILSQVEMLKLNSKMQNLKPFFNKIGGYEEISVKFSLEGVTAEELTKFLYQIENSSYLLYIGQIQIKPQSYDNLFLLNVSFKIQTYMIE